MHILRVATVFEPQVKLLPKEFGSALTKQDREAIRNSEVFFSRLSTQAKPRWLRRLLERCAESGWQLLFAAWGDQDYRPYYRFFWSEGLAMSLPRKKTPRSDLPLFPRHIYGLIGSIRMNGLEDAGGIYAGDGIGPVSEMGIWVEPDGEIDPSHAVFFLDTEAGSQLCYLPDGAGVWLEAGRFRRVRSLEKEVANYFDQLLT
jgi:hypothetical protein